jgi:O-antigen ligase
MIVIDKVNFPINYFRKFLEFSEIAFVIIYLILYAAGVVVLFLMGGASEGEKGTVQEFDFALNRILFFFNYLIVLLLLILRWKKTLYTLMSRSNILILMLIALVPLSTLWSVEPGKTLSASIAMIGTCLFGLYLASNYSPKQQLQLLGFSFIISIILSFIFAIALRKYGLMGGVHAGAWRGIYTHKNWLGRMMVLASGILFLLANDAKKYRRILWIFFSLAFLLILLSRSSSSLINAVIVLFTVWVSRIFRFQTKLLIPVILSVIAAGVILSLSASSIAEVVVGSLGKDLSGTGRTEIWPYSIEKIYQRPFLGYGFAVFWNGLKGESAIIIRALKWPVPNSHNGFIDLGIDLGLLGISLFAASFFQTLMNSIVWIRRTQSWISLWSLLLLLFIVLSNTTESALLDRNSLIWVMYTALIFTLSLEQRNYQFGTSKEKSSVELP